MLFRSKGAMLLAIRGQTRVAFPGADKVILRGQIPTFVDLLVFNVFIMARQAKSYSKGKYKLRVLIQSAIAACCTISAEAHSNSEFSKRDGTKKRS